MTIALANMHEELQANFPDDALNDTVAKYLELARSEFAEFDKKNEAAFKRLKKNVDDFEGTTWYKNPYFTHYNFSNNVSTYIGMSGKHIWMRLLVTYSGNDWIFFDECNIKFGDDPFPVVFNKYDKQTDVNG